MTDCLSTDAIVAIGDALNWDVTQGLAHLQTCEECRANLEMLRLTREGLVASQPVDAVVLRRISAAVSAVAEAERRQAALRSRWTQAAEAFLAGIAALIVLHSSGVRIESIGGAVLAFALGAALMAIGGGVARSVPALGSGVAHA